MGSVMIACPTTGRLVDTRLRLSRQDFEEMGSDNNVLHCPRCGKPHVLHHHRVSLSVDDEVYMELVRRSGRRSGEKVSWPAG